MITNLPYPLQRAYTFFRHYYYGLLTVMLLLTQGNDVTAQNHYTWIATGTGDWNAAANWSPARTVAAGDDVLLFNGGGSVTITNIPTQQAGSIQVNNSTTVNLQFATGGSVLTITGISGGDDFIVDAGSSLNNNGANAGTIYLNSGATAAVSGTITFTAAAHRMDAADAGAVQFNSGAVCTQGTGCSGNLFTSTGTAGAVVFNSGSSFVQQAGANPFGLSQPASKVLFNTGSLFKAQQSSFLSFSGRTYANLEIDFAGFNQAVTGTSVLNLQNLTLTQGTLSLNLTGGINLKGDIAVAIGQALHFTPASVATVHFNGSTAQHIYNSGTLDFGSNAAVEINNAAGITIGAAITFNHTLTFTAGIVTVSAPYILTCSATATVSGAGNSSFIDGLVKKVGNTAFTFPVGAAGTGYVPLGITAPALATDAFVCAYKRTASSTLGGGYPAGLDHTSGVDYWVLNQTNGSSTVDITPYWTVQSSGNGGALYINDLNKLVVAHHNGTAWDAYGGAYNTGSGFAAGSVTWQHVNSFGAFALGSTDVTNPLAIGQGPGTTVPPGSRNSKLPLEVINSTGNPVQGNALLRVTVSYKTMAQLRVIDAAGRQVLLQHIQLQKGRTDINVSLNGLPAGIYYVQVSTAQQDAAVVRMVKQ
ncbi:MAG: T9SS type A sorting domain-containing protein [Bacteroidetes bacterium]|nr:T9SS type A sorting domain-containing protein [Bacteroidota bacterium]